MNRLILFCFLILLFSACASNTKEKQIASSTSTPNFDYSKFELKPGDILFQDSDCGPFCESIEKVTMGFKGSKFSHVGIVVPKGEKDLIILEAISSGVVETSLNRFFGRSFDEQDQSKVVVGRIKKEHTHLIPKAIEFAKTKLGAPYDEVFDISNDKYYCSELIYDSFKFSNKNQPIFELQKMTYNDPETNRVFPIWERYFQKLDIPIPEGQPGLNPGGMSQSTYIDIVHFYGKPEGYPADIK